MKKFILSFIIYILFCPSGKAYAIDRLVTSYIISDKWYENIFLMADKVDSMVTQNFTIQVGASGDSVGGELLYNFPHWYNDKFAPGLFYEDINGNALKDIVVVLISGAGSGLSTKEIHILNQMKVPDRKYEEVPVESINDAVTRLVKMERHDNQATILMGNKKYVVDLSKFHYKMPFEDRPFVGMIENYEVVNGVLYGLKTVFVSIAGDIGSLKIKYAWNGQRYRAESISFDEAKPYMSSINSSKWETHGRLYGCKVSLY